MQAIRQTALLNKRELENATPPSASWHADYRDTAWIYVGGLPNDLSEGDVCIIFSQFGNPTHLNLIRDKETGKSKGFGFLKYEDQRSCDLAVDNLGGAEVLGRMLRVDHSRYKRKEGEDEETFRIEKREREQFGGGDSGGSDTEAENEDGERRKRKKRKLLKEERELRDMLAITANEGEEDDPMREYLIREKREEVEKARSREKERRRKHQHRGRRDEDGGEDSKKTRRHRHDDHDENDEYGNYNRERHPELAVDKGDALPDREKGRGEEAVTKESGRSREYKRSDRMQDDSSRHRRRDDSQSGSSSRSRSRSRSPRRR